MLYPTLKKTNPKTETVTSFGGLDRRDKISPNSLSDMKNLNSDAYPLLCVRPPRRHLQTFTEPVSLISKDALCYLLGSRFYINDYPTDLSLKPYHRADLVSMGAYVLIFTFDTFGNPLENRYINTLNHEDNGSLDASCHATQAVFELCMADGTTYNAITYSDQKPNQSEEGDLWMDTASGTLKQYSTENGGYFALPACHIRITSPKIGALFSEGDGVYLQIPDLPDLSGNHLIVSRSEDAIIIEGSLSSPITASLTVERKAPYMDFIIESENRLWGCRYGTDREGNIVNEIYASKQGDFKNWQVYAGISTDSYALTLGSDGAFTGAITHLGYPLFFKENCLHKIYGSTPENFRMQTTALRGVKKGASRSLAIASELLLYQSPDGICAYDGSLPNLISAPVFDLCQKDGVAGSYQNKYYLSVKDGENNSHLLVFDIAKGLWHREDALSVESFCRHKDALYFVCDNGKLLAYGQTKGEEESPVSFMVQTAALGIDQLTKKYLLGLHVRLKLPLGAKLRISVQYDGRGDYRHLGSIRGKGEHFVTLPIKLRRCDFFRLRLEGQGDMKLYSLTRFLEGGSLQ